MRQLITVIVSLVLGMAATFILMTVRPVPPELDVEPDPVFAAVTIHEERLVVATSLEIVKSEPHTVVSAGWAGRVTAVHVEPGSTLASGDTIAVVGAISLPAFATPMPFWRSLSRGVEGDDVAMLQCLLVSEGLYDGPCDGAFGAATGAAVTAFNETIGVGDVATFDPASVLWLPADTLKVAEVAVEVGLWFPGPGEPVLVSDRDVEAAALDVQGLSNADVAAFAPLQFESQPGGVAIPVGDDLIVSPDDASRLLESVSATPEPDGEAGVDASARILVSGVLRGQGRIEWLSVPTASLIESSTGTCIFTDRLGELEAASVVIIGSSVTGSTFVDGNVNPGDQVVTNPGALELTSC